jgi:PIN domain nuclease of toxin-antitoxin system
MDYLLDTNILIKAYSNPESLNDKVKEILSSPKTTVYVSYVSFWEIEIKRNLGKISIPKNMFDDVFDDGLLILDFRMSHIHWLSKLPDLHRDPFDRMLVAQAISENLQLITTDKIVKKYDKSFILT